MRRFLPVAVLLAFAFASSVARADFLSKRFEFKAGVVLEIGVATAEGVRLDTVRFQVPTPVQGRHERSGGLVKAEVTISNTASVPFRVGIAMALFDGEQRLLGVASGGTALIPIKPGRQKTFDLVFDDVNDRVHGATSFQISLEPK